MPDDSEIDESVLEEGAYHLSELGLTHAQIAAEPDDGNGAQDGKSPSLSYAA